MARAERAYSAAAITRDPLGRPQADGMALEDFGMIDNLMLHAAVTTSGFAPVASEVAPEARFSALANFEQAVAMAVPYFYPSDVDEA